jgi:ribokinase
MDMENSPEIIVVGSHAPGILIHTECIPVAGETVMGWGFEEPIDGGKGSNQAIAAARLGARTAFIGCVGKDRIGQQARELMDNSGVETRCLYEVDDTPTGLGFIILNRNGVPAMVSSDGANSILDEQMVCNGFESLGNPKVLLTQFEIRPEIAIYAAKIARNNGSISIINPAPAANVNLKDLAFAHILVPNETEAKTLLGLDLEIDINGIDLAKELKEKTGCEVVLVTLGENGIAGIDGDGTWIVNPPRIKAVDTSGAGDVFCAALAAGLVRGMGIRISTNWAVQVASLSVTRSGTIPSFPTFHEVEKFLIK